MTDHEVQSGFDDRGESDAGCTIGSMDGESVRDRIVTAAAHLTFERGVRRATVDDIRAAAGVSGSQMSRHFRDKQSLISAVITRQADAVMNLHRIPALHSLDSFDALRLWADMFVEMLRQRDCRGGCAFGTLAAELAGTDARDELADVFDRWTDLLRAGLRAMRDRGDLRLDADPDELALGLLSALQGGRLLAQIRRDVGPVEAALNTMLARIRSFATDPVTALPDPR